MDEAFDAFPDSERLAAAWPVGRWKALRRLVAGRTNESFHLSAAAGEFVLRRLREGKSADSLGFELDLIDRLGAHGVPVAAAVPTAEGEPWIEISGRLWTLSSFVATDAEPSRLDAARLAGEVLARFHEAVAGWGLDRAPLQQDRSALALAGLESLADAAVPRELTFVRGRCRDVLEALLSSMPLITAGLGTTLIHGACRTSSLLYREGKVAALLDMDSSRRGPVAEDLGIALASFAKCRSGDEAVRVEPATALLAAYRSVREIGNDELNALPACLAQALVYPLVKALGRLAEGRASAAEFERGAWRLAAAEHAVARAAQLVERLQSF